MIRTPHRKFRLGCLFWLCGFLHLSPAWGSEWTVLENCRLVDSQSNDADSFAVESPVAFRGEKQNRFRLYFVDAAETDMNSDFKKERLLEQAAYWENDDPEFALQMGLRAKQMVHKLLRSRFEIYTKGEYAPTLGAPRYYALIRVDDRWLDEILVEEGLARIYGEGSDLPNDRSEKMHWSELRQLERAARQHRVNGWSRSDTEPVPAETFAPHDAVTGRATWIYSLKDGHKVTVLPQGTTVSIMETEENGRVRVRFKKSGQIYEGLCAEKDLQP